MFFVFLAFALVILGLVGILGQIWKDYKKGVNNDYGDGGFGILMIIFVVIVLVVGLVASMFANSDQIASKYELEKIAQFERTYQARADNLTKQFARHLADAYPQHERDVFAKIEPGNLDIYLVKYPELQASKTMMALVDQERSLRDDIYKQQLQRAEVVRDMKYRAHSPWVYQWMMPNIEIPAQ